MGLLALGSLQIDNRESIRVLLRWAKEDRRHECSTQKALAGGVLRWGYIHTHVVQTSVWQGTSDIIGTNVTT